MTFPDPLRHHLSLMHGWIPVTIQIVAGIALVAAIGWRTRRWRYLWLPWAALCGVTVTAATYWYIASQGLADDPAPRGLWIWIGLSGAAAAVLIAGWRGAKWWRRGVAVTALPLCLLCAALALNLWVGYFPTVQTAWNQLTAGPLPDETDQVTVLAMQERHQIPAKGTVVPVQIDDGASGFKHRGELVYLPPAWYATNPPPPLPTIMMIGGEFNTPADWVRIGNAVSTADEFAAAHGGNAPVMVFVDSGGAFNNDTECVNGTRGNVADHLTKDVVPYMVSHFGASPHRENWGVVGWSMGGTCAVDLAVMHPDMFSAFEDIAGDIAPNTGTKDQTIARLFGGNAAAYAAFDPTTVIAPTACTPASPDGSTSTARRPRHSGRRRIHCARWETPTESPVRSSPSPASTIGRSPRMRLPTRCPGWPVSWPLRARRRSRCPRRRRPRRSSRRSPSSGYRRPHAGRTNSDAGADR